jgi:hypothetical protein
MNADGNSIQTLTPADVWSGEPTWSHDGESLYYASLRSGVLETWKQHISSGEAISINKGGSVIARESYDGKMIYFTPPGESDIWSRPLKGGLATRITNPAQIGRLGGWDITEAGIFLFDIADLFRPRLIFYQFKTHQFRKILQLKKPVSRDQLALSASRDGHLLIFSQRDWKMTITTTTSEAASD